MIMLKKLSLRIRIFLSMIVLILIAYAMIAIITLFQYEEQKKEYNASRFERKEDAIRLNINYIFKQSGYDETTVNLPVIFNRAIKELSSIHKMNIKMYNLEGELLISSDLKKFDGGNVSEKILQQLKEKNRFLQVKKTEANNGSLQVSYTYIYDFCDTPIAVLKLYYTQDNTFQDKDLKEFLYRLGFVYLLIFLVAIIFAYFLSSFITKSINTVIAKMSNTGLNKKNEKIYLEETSVEIQKLLEAYNKMVDELELSAIKLAQSEREHAWREMAKQVAHEIKNPLTPMRLTVQSFERRFDPTAVDNKEKLKEYSETLIQQIDMLSAIASAFSDFAQMPTKNKEQLEIVSIIKKSLDIYSKEQIEFSSDKETIYIEFDKNQLIRIVTNLMQNAIQATEEIIDSKIYLKLVETIDTLEIYVEDNGKGISKELHELVFEPKFTTKSSGMGLGLPMIKKIIESYGGSLTFSSEVGKGTKFKVVLPKIN